MKSNVARNAPFCALSALLDAEWVRCSAQGTATFQAAHTCVGCSARCNITNNEVWHELSRHLRLSPREVAILKGFLEDKKEVAIAASIGISPHTVHTHVERLYRKLQVHDRCMAILRVFSLFFCLAQRPCGWHHSHFSQSTVT